MASPRPPSCRWVKRIVGPCEPPHHQQHQHHQQLNDDGLEHTAFFALRHGPPPCERANEQWAVQKKKKNNRPPPVQPIATRPIDRTPQRPFDPNRARACCLRWPRGRAGCSLGFGIRGRRSASVEMIEALKRSLQRKAVLPRCAERFTFDHKAFSSAWPPSVIVFALHLRPKVAFNGSIDSVGS